MAADELTALQRAAGVVSDLDPATAWDLDGQLDGLAQVTLILAEGMGTWSERLHGIGLHHTVTDPIEAGVTGLGEIAAGLTQSRRALRTAYAAFFAAAEANVRNVDRPAFWGADAVSRGRHRTATVPSTEPARPGPAAAPPPAVQPQPAPLPRGQVEPGDGPPPDVACLADLPSGWWHGSDVVAGDGEAKVVLGLVRYTNPPTSGYVAVATIADPGWNPDADGSGVIPGLSAREANQLADELDDLVALAQNGTQLSPPTELAKLADRIRGLLGSSGVTVIGDEGQTDVSAAMIQQLLDAAAPPPAQPTRRKVTAKDCDQDRMDTGTVWAEIDTSGTAPVIAVTSTEGTEDPEESPEEYPDFYTTTRLQLADASRLAAKLRRFAKATPQVTSGESRDWPDARDQAGQEPHPAPAPAATAGPRRVRTPRGKQLEFDPGTNTAAVIEPDGWRAVVTPNSSTGIAARLLYWNAEIKDGRGDDATDQAARALLDGLTSAELREVASELGVSAPGARTKTQWTDAIVNMAVSAPRKVRGLLRW